jgi:hypothetical protein
MRTKDELDFGAVLELLDGELIELVCDCGYRQTVSGLDLAIVLGKEHNARCHDE